MYKLFRLYIVEHQTWKFFLQNLSYVFCSQNDKSYQLSLLCRSGLRALCPSDWCDQDSQSVTTRRDFQTKRLTRTATRSCCTAGCSAWGCPSTARELSRTSPCPAWHTWEAPRQSRWQLGACPAWERSLRSSRRVRGRPPPGCPRPRSWTESLRRSCD